MIYVRKGEVVETHRAGGFAGAARQWFDRRSGVRWRYRGTIGVAFAVWLGALVTAGAPAICQPVLAETAPAAGAMIVKPSPFPRPLPPGPPPFFPRGTWSPGGGVPPLIAGDLASEIIDAQQALDAVVMWIRSAEQAVQDAIGEIVLAAPGYLPQGTDLSQLIGTVTGLPEALKQTLAGVLARWQGEVQPGTPAADHQAYVSASPELTHEATGIAVTSATVAAGNVRQELAVNSTSQDAAAVAADPVLPAAALAARQAGAALLQGAPQVPSARAGIELLVAGMGTTMQQQADFDTAIADRLTVLAQQLAFVSQQMGALGETAAALAARDAERDRRDLDARLGLMDAARAGGQALSQMLVGADEASDVELSPGPLY